MADSTQLIEQAAAEGIEVTVDFAEQIREITPEMAESMEGVAPGPMPKSIIVAMAVARHPSVEAQLVTGGSVDCSPLFEEAVIEQCRAAAVTEAVEEMRAWLRSMDVASA
jgi:hypothetical protein